MRIPTAARTVEADLRREEQAVAYPHDDQARLLMHPAFREAVLRDNRSSLERKLRQAYLRRTHDPVPRFPLESVTLRLAREHDDETLERLAELNGLARVDGAHVVAEVEGAVTAAMPLGVGPALGDPFRPNAHLMSLLGLLRQQLAVQDGGSSRSRWFPRFGKRATSRAATSY